MEVLYDMNFDSKKCWKFLWAANTVVQSTTNSMKIENQLDRIDPYLVDILNHQDRFSNLRVVNSKLIGVGDGLSITNP